MPKGQPPSKTLLTKLKKLEKDMIKLERRHGAVAENKRTDTEVGSTMNKLIRRGQKKLFEARRQRMEGTAEYKSLFKRINKYDNLSEFTE